jgi:site-specific DNA-methyltransferase (adenine-specific)
MRELVKVAPRNGVVLDPFAGSGTTGVAALMEGRRVILVERTHEYSDIARRRCEAAEKGVDWRADPRQESLFGRLA